MFKGKELWIGGSILAGILLTIIIGGIVSADVIGCKVTGNSGLVEMDGEIVSYGTFFCIGNDEGDSYCITCKHVTEMDDLLSGYPGVERTELTALIYERGEYYEYPLEVIDEHPNHDIALVKIIGKELIPLELMDDRGVRKGASLYLETDIFEVSESVEAYGKMTSGRAWIGDLEVRLADIDVVGGYSGTAVRMAFAREKVVGMVMAEHRQNGVTILVPAGIILDWLKGGEEK